MLACAIGRPSATNVVFSNVKKQFMFKCYYFFFLHGIKWRLILVVSVQTTRFLVS